MVLAFQTLFYHTHYVIYLSLLLIWYHCDMKYTCHTDTLYITSMSNS